MRLGLRRRDHRQPGATSPRRWGLRGAAGLVALVVAVAAQAETDTPDSAGAASGQDRATPVEGATRGAAGRRLAVVPGASASLQYSEFKATPDAVRDGHTVVARVEPSLRLALRSGAVQGTLAYTLTAQQAQGDLEARGGEPRSLQNALNTQWVLTPNEHFRLDAQATISRQNRSAFGSQAGDNSLAAESNRVEVGSASISPSVRWRLGSWAEARLRFQASGANARDSIVGDSTTWGTDFSLGSPSSLLGVGWSVGLSQQTSDFRAGRETENERAFASVFWRPDIDWQFSLRGGQERSDVGALVPQRYDNWGFGVTWTPSPRTQLSLEEERRFFGNAWTAQFQYRTPRTIWRYSSNRSSSESGASGGGGASVTAYQLVFAQFASRFPDPVERDVQVRDFLRALDIDPDSLVAGGAVNGAISLQQRQDASVAWNGSRARVVAQAYTSKTRVLDTVGVGRGVDEGLTSLWGWSVSMGWQLLPGWSVSLTGGRQVTRPNEIRFGTDLKSVSLSLNGQIGRQATLGLNGRYAVFNSATAPYRETSLGASLGLRF